jgi:hypothetical protein
MGESDPTVSQPPKPVCDLEFMAYPEGSQEKFPERL